MKKMFSILLIALLISSLAGCSGSKEITLSLPEGEVTGMYTGDMEDGLPNGHGTFQSTSTEFENWSYEGDWNLGLMEGFGTCKWEDGRSYIGGYKNGYMHGEGTVYQNGSLLYSANYQYGHLSGVIREEAAYPEDVASEYVQIGDMGVEIPATWTFDAIDDRAANITIPGEENVRIIFSVDEYIDFTNSDVRPGYIFDLVSAFSDVYPDYILVSETEEGLFMNDDEYDVHICFQNDNEIADVYCHSETRDPTGGEAATYSVVTIIKGTETPDYSTAAGHLTYTMKRWDAVQKDIAENKANQAHQEVLTLLAGNYDWPQLENILQPITEQDFLNRVPPETCFGIVEGVIDNITENTFDIWLPHSGSYAHRESWPCGADVTDIRDGMTVQVCIEVHNDCSLKQVWAIRATSNPIIADIVDEFKKSCASIDYKEIMRDPDEAYGSIWGARGKVLQVVETKDSLQEFLLTLDDGNVLYVDYYKVDGAPNVVEGDELNVYGTFYFTKTYTTPILTSNTVPVLSVDYIDFE